MLTDYVIHLQLGRKVHKIDCKEGNRNEIRIQEKVKIKERKKEENDDVEERKGGKRFSQVNSSLVDFCCTTSFF
jgi:hypothetical protein